MCCVDEIYCRLTINSLPDTLVFLGREVLHVLCECTILSEVGKLERICARCVQCYTV